ncbi:MAG: ferredoxin [Patescibacteria group bacterium]|nr:ferredoxin [Patescibacteria group bacterium]
MALKVQIDENLCIGCGTCVSIASKSFQMEGAKAKAIEPAGDSDEMARDAVGSCPVKAIKIEE